MKNAIYLALICLFFSSCTSSSDTNWTTAVPEESSFIIVAEADATVDSVLQSAYLPQLENVSSSAIQLISQLDSSASNSLQVQSIILYPGTEQKLQPIWVFENQEGMVGKLKKRYARNFTENDYSFDNTSILRLNIQNRTLFIAQVGELLLVSESSIGLENAVRTYSGKRPAADLTSIDLDQGTFVVNTPSLDLWLAKMAKVTYHPAIKGLFNGTSPAVMTVSEAQNELRLSGNISLQPDAGNSVISAVSQQNKEITLDDYISSDAAAFGIFQSPALQELKSPLPDTSDFDKTLLDNPDMMNAISSSLDTELAIVMYAESGFLSTGEYLFIRKLSNTQALRSRLESLSEQGLIKKADGLYFAQSYGMGQLFSSGLSNFKDFYINITGDAVVLSKRKGLAELVASDRNRRRVIAYEPFFEDIKASFAEDLSGLVVAGPEFNSFITPFLSPNNYVNTLASSYNYIALATRVNENESGNNLSVDLLTLNSQNGNQPFHENWLSNAGGADLSGNPVFGNIGGSSNDEVIYATQTGNVYAVAADGTVVQQYNTGRDVPIGSPVVYDWYGTGQNVVLLAAGNKIYGWDENGDILPKFPLQLSEKITTPLTITDLNNNRIPDAVVGTADRKLHVLNGRGQNLSGWPVTVNTPVNTAPLVSYFRGGPAVIAFSSNAVHAWDATGRPISNFPVFVNAGFRGSPALLESTILGNGVDGNLYAIGNDIPFSDSLNVYRSIESNTQVKAVNISNNSLSGTPFVYENSILTAAENGSVSLLNANGQLQITKNMGQPSARNWPAIITDINSDGQQDMVALASYGRLYAWQLSSGERIQNLPTAAMKALSIGDLDGDGQKEIVAQTEKGIQSWTINR